jgi:hypothetical protein
MATDIDLDECMSLPASLEAAEKLHAELVRDGGWVAWAALCDRVGVPRLGADRDSVRSVIYFALGAEKLVKDGRMERTWVVAGEDGVVIKWFPDDHDSDAVMRSLEFAAGLEAAGRKVTHAGLVRAAR